MVERKFRAEEAAQRRRKEGSPIAGNYTAGEKGTKGEKAVKSIINVKVCYIEGRKTSVYLQITRSGVENTTGGHKRIRIGFRSEFDERERERVPFRDD